jgi:hypothetical protein
MGFRVKLHGNNFEPLMSALGQKPVSRLCRKFKLGTVKTAARKLILIKVCVGHRS